MILRKSILITEENSDIEEGHINYGGKIVILAKGKNTAGFFSHK